MGKMNSNKVENTVIQAPFFPKTGSQAAVTQVSRRARNEAAFKNKDEKI